ncbi:MAG: PAS domain-containing protein [Desulfobacterales bacterium]|uniref:PAS domain-containing protein n=1 Tax=Candidatus Desulfatibia vada TaxID=2841696 RepID=A0A8J6NTX9_9BACT|nr:PAS domain-containing protein [Candidatus Desulfatibia vada]MBL6971699.1 PAS domain-containing protein [Desulfobacterales bacterium]
MVRDGLNFSVSGVIIADLEGNIRHVNNTFLRLLEYDGKGDFYGKNAADLFASDKVGTFADVKAMINPESLNPNMESAMKRATKTLEFYVYIDNWAGGR